MRSNHFYFVTELSIIRCHKRLKLCNNKLERGNKSLKKKESPLRRRRYWKSNKFLTQISQILSLSALIAGKDYTMIKKAFFIIIIFAIFSHELLFIFIFFRCSPLNREERKLWIEPNDCQIKSNLLDHCGLMLEFKHSVVNITKDFVTLTFNLFTKNSFSRSFFLYRNRNK